MCAFICLCAVLETVIGKKKKRVCVVQGVPKVSLHFPFLQNLNSGKLQKPNTQLIKRRFWAAVVSQVFIYAEIVNLLLGHLGPVYVD